MKNISQKLNLRWMSGVYQLDNQHFTPPHSICKYVTYPIFLLFFVFAVCGCINNQEHIESPTNTQLSSPASSAGADSLMSVLEGVGSWRVMAINKVVSSFTINLSTEGTTVCFANSEVTFAVPYTSINFDDNSEPTEEYEQHGPYSVDYKSANILYIADELFIVSAMANGYTLKSEKIEIKLAE